MNKIIPLDENNIKNRIYTIRGLKVMLYSDLAKLYEIKSIRLREQVKRNIERFPKDFMFQLTENEVKLLVSQNAIPSKQHLGGSIPYVFTEQGVATLSGVLRSKKAVEVNIQIMRAFVSMRKFFTKNADIFLRLDNVERKLIEFQLDSDEKFKKIFEAIEDQSIIKKKGIFFNGQIFDAYRFFSDLIKSAQKSLILIDNYIDDSVLTFFSKRKENIEVIIYTKNFTKELKLDLKKYNSQYQNIVIKEFKDSHDRFMIIDNKEMYHIGASLKDLGKKWFAFSKFESFEIIEKIKKLLGDE